LAYADSQPSWKCLTVVVWPRSTWIHCASVQSLAQRVFQSPSVAFEAGSGPLGPVGWKDEAVVVLPFATFVPLYGGATTRNERDSTPTLP
jgi:hypothetical protein